MEAECRRSASEVLSAQTGLRSWPWARAISGGFLRSRQGDQDAVISKAELPGRPGAGVRMQG